MHRAALSKGEDKYFFLKWKKKRVEKLGICIKKREEEVCVRTTTDGNGCIFGLLF